MSPVDHPNLVSLIRRTRRGLWLGNILALVDGAVWCAGASFVVAGLAHVLLAAMPSQYVLGLAAILILIAFSLGVVLHRPSLQCAAMAADRLLAC